MSQVSYYVMTFTQIIWSPVLRQVYFPSEPQSPHLEDGEFKWFLWRFRRASYSFFSEKKWCCHLKRKGWPVLKPTVLIGRDDGMKHVGKWGGPAKATICWVPAGFLCTHYLPESLEQPCKVCLSILLFQMKKLRFKGVKGVAQDQSWWRAGSVPPHGVIAIVISLLSFGNLESDTCFLGMYSWKLYSTVALKFLEKDVNICVLLKPREHTRQYGERAGGVHQSSGGGGGREDQPADGREEESR